MYNSTIIFEYISARTPEKDEAAWLEKAVMAAIDEGGWNWGTGCSAHQRNPATETR
jgi:hypothetical protein